MEPDYLIKLNKVSKIFSGPAGTKSVILDDINLVINKRGKIISLLGSFGSGKSTLLKIISKLDKPTSGEIIYQNKSDVIPYIPEKSSSYPWLNVKENIQFALSLKNDIHENEDLILELIQLVGLTGYENHFPNNRSAGFRFRIALARALAVQPELILIDDCFKGIDRITKAEIFSLIEAAVTKYEIPVLFATTNITDAVLYSEKIILMNKNPGKIISEINNKSGNKDKKQLLSENFTSIKSEIENILKIGNQLSSLDISI